MTRAPSRWHALVVEDEAASRTALEALLAADGFEVVAVASCAAVRAFMGSAPATNDAPSAELDVAFVDLGLPDGDGLDLIGPLLALPHGCAVVVLSGERRLERAIEAMRRGASDYLVKPLDAAGLRLALARIERQLDERDERRRLARELMWHGSYQGLIGRSPKMRAVFEQIERAAPSDLPIFARGESGTGKELLARAIHQVSRRRRGPFVAVNCGAIPAQLAESELFGHERGAFTGAVRPQVGAFERAHGGTLFLDEVTEMPLETQVVLLRALEVGTIQKVGGNKEQKVDVRIVAATNRDPHEAVRDGRLRQDLLFRLDVIPIALPPLRERGDDLLLLAQHLLDGHAAATGRAAPPLSSAALSALRAHPWPGNVRELKNAILRAAVLHEGPEVNPADLGLPDPLTAAAPSAPASVALDGAAGHGPPFGPSTGGLVIAPDATLAEAERLITLAVLERLSWNRAAASQALGIAPKTLYNKLKAWGITTP